MNNTIYVTGHKHPDSDSICAAITYTDFLNRTGEHAIACRQGPLNEETKFILKRFHQENPLLLTDARSTLADIDLDRPRVIMKDETVHHAWHVMMHSQNRSLFVLDNEGNLAGVCTTSDLSRYRIEKDADLVELMSTATLKNIARTIGGKIAVNVRDWHGNGTVHVITLEGHEASKYPLKGGICILSSGEEKAKHLISENGVKCLVLTCGAKASDEVRALALKNGCAIIETDDDTMHTARVINESYSVEQVMTKKVVTFQTTEYVDDAAAKIAKSRVRSYPVLNERGEVVGAISLHHTRNYQRRRIALVDHSAPNQTINHYDSAQITAIIDHHHIGGVTTSTPIMYRNQRVGCTCTILTQMYQERGLEPAPEMCGLLMSAILSDTLNFKSATTTQLDRDTVAWLAVRAGIDDVNAYARDMLGASVALKDSTPHEIINRDLKAYEIGKYRFAIGQTNFSHMEDVQKILPAISEQLEKEQASSKLDLMVMLFTDVMGEGSLFVYHGPLSYLMPSVIETTFDDHSGFDPHIISRKQQMMPKLSAVIKDI